jgi:hypothetical protein
VSTPAPHVSRYADPDKLEELILNEVVSRFLKSPTSTQQIAEEINALYGTQLTREQIYPVLRKAVRRHVLIHTPSRDMVLESRLRTSALKAEARGATQGSIAVVNSIGALAAENVPSGAAKLVLGLLKEVASARPGKNVHIGIGIGWSTMRFCRQLGALLRDDVEAPALSVHALATSYSFWSPLETPIASFTYLANAYRPPVEFVGLFAQPFEKSEHYQKLLERKEVKAALERRDEIDIVVTSLASGDGGECEHGYLCKHLLEYGPENGIEALQQQGWIGDVQLRPYSARGPLAIQHGHIKPVTLFELDELAAHVARGKYVVLLCSPCGRCYRSKAAAVMPLLEEPSLRVWSHLVIDYGTAYHVITGDEHPAALRLRESDQKGREFGPE